MICYIYKITCLCGSFKDHYYIGQRRYKGKDVDMDRYTGSGKLIKDYFKKYGFNGTYVKQILEIVPTKELLNQREKIYVGDLWEIDPLCLNLCAGGYSPGWCEESRERLSISQKNIGRITLFLKKSVNVCLKCLRVKIILSMERNIPRKQEKRCL